MQLTHSDGVEKYVQVLAKHTADIRKTRRTRSALVHQRLTTLPGVGNGVQRRQLPAVGGAPSVSDSVHRGSFRSSCRSPAYLPDKCMNKYHTQCPKSSNLPADNNNTTKYTGLSNTLYRNYINQKQIFTTHILPQQF